DSDAFLTLLAARVVFVRSQLVPDHGIADYQLNFVRNWQCLRFQRTAVEHHRVTGFAKAGDELIHQSGARPDKFVLSLLANLRKLQTSNFLRRDIQESQSS